jgi:hypothetical protein
MQVFQDRGCSMQAAGVRRSSIFHTIFHLFIDYEYDYSYTSSVLALLKAENAYI